MLKLLPLLTTLICVNCFAEPLKSQTESHTRLIEILPRKEINIQTTGINAFANQPEFGTPAAQFQEISETLHIKDLRLLFAWTDAVQPSPQDRLDHNFNDELIRSLPAGSRALIVISNLPSWMSNSANWIGGDPRLTFLRKWIRPVIRRYRRKRKIVGFQIFNEPNNPSFSESTTLETLNSPENYIDLLSKAHRFIKRRAKKKLVVGAATTSIFQNFPETLEYNQALLDLGIENYLDVFAIHVYGSSMERYFLGIEDFLRSLSKPIWVTESGQRGYLEQLEYVQRVWPFLEEELGIERFYFYRFAESASASESWGLKNSTPATPVSDLYVHLRDNF